jgi:hypothetical protein
MQSYPIYRIAAYEGVIETLKSTGEAEKAGLQARLDDVTQKHSIAISALEAKDKELLQIGEVAREQKDKLAAIHDESAAQAQQRENASLSSAMGA